MEFAERSGDVSDGNRRERLISFGLSMHLHCSERCREEGCGEELHFDNLGLFWCVWWKRDLRMMFLILNGRAGSSPFTSAMYPSSQLVHPDKLMTLLNFPQPLWCFPRGAMVPRL